MRNFDKSKFFNSENTKFTYSIQDGVEILLIYHWGVDPCWSAYATGGSVTWTAKYCDSPQAALENLYKTMQEGRAHVELVLNTIDSEF